MNWQTLNGFTEAFKKLRCDLGFGNEEVVVNSKYVTVMGQGWVPKSDRTIESFAAGLNRPHVRKPYQYALPAAADLISLANKQGGRMAYREWLASHRGKLPNSARTTVQYPVSTAPIPVPCGRGEPDRLAAP